MTGPRVLQADVPWDASHLGPAFLAALADEADDTLDLLVGLSCVPMVLINYYTDKLTSPAPRRLRDGRYELASIRR